MANDWLEKNLQSFARGLQLFSFNNPKTSKDAVKNGYLPIILHLAPSDESGIGNVCPYAGACKTLCLYHQGRGRPEMINRKGVNVVREARIRRTKLFYQKRADFFDLATQDLFRLIDHAARLGVQPCVRMNGTSDIRWEKVAYRGGVSIVDYWYGLQFYDYTKWPIQRRGQKDNYHLTFSLDTKNTAEALDALEYHGVNVAVPFRTRNEDELPKYFLLDDGMDRENTYTVMNGNKSDLRFLDEPGNIVALTARGTALKDTSGFVKEIR